MDSIFLSLTNLELKAFGHLNVEVSISNKILLFTRVDYLYFFTRLIRTSVIFNNLIFNFRHILKLGDFLQNKSTPRLSK